MVSVYFVTESAKEIKIKCRRSRHPPSPGVGPWASLLKTMLMRRTLSCCCGWCCCDLKSSADLWARTGRRVLFSIRAAVSRGNLIGWQHGDQFPERTEQELLSLLGAQNNSHHPHPDNSHRFKVVLFKFRS